MRMATRNEYPTTTLAIFCAAIAASAGVVAAVAPAHAAPSGKNKTPAAASAAAPSAAQHPTAQQLLDAIDKNLTFESRTANITMVVKSSHRTRTYQMVTYGRGQDDAAIEYLEPPREKGTRMLKLGGELWIYMPSIDRVQKISGHMLREGMMGSDVSYEDLMSAKEMRKMYSATVTGDDVVDGHPCWKLQMIAHNDSVSYPKRVTCIDKKTFIPLRQQLYALSGMLLKTWTMSKVKEFPGGRRFPTQMEVRDEVKKASVTRLTFSDIRFGVALEREVFSLRWLERH